MKHLLLFLIPLTLCAADAYKPRRINKAIELLEQGQPIYYSSTSGGGYEDGRKLARTRAQPKVDTAHQQ